VHGRRELSLFAFLILFCAAGCQTTDNGGKVGLPPPRPDATNFSDYKPDAPLTPTRDGLAERSVFTSDSGDGYVVEVRDFLISPKQASVVVPLNGGAVVEVRDGAGNATVGDRRMEIQRGSVLTVNEGEQLVITAKGDPVTLRTWIARAR